MWIFLTVRQGSHEQGNGPASHYLKMGDSLWNVIVTIPGIKRSIALQHVWLQIAIFMFEYTVPFEKVWIKNVMSKRPEPLAYKEKKKEANQPLISKPGNTWMAF